MSKTKNWINFCGVSSESIPGLIINELPPIQMTPKRIKQIEIEGKDGDIIDELGYMAYDKTAQISLSGDYDIDKVFEWLNRSGNIIFSNEPDKVYKVAVYDTVAFERLVKCRKASVKFHTQPFKTLYNEELRFITDDAAGIRNLLVKNQGNIYSQPTIEADIGTTNWLYLTINGEAIRVIFEKAENEKYTAIFNLENGKISILNSSSAEVELDILNYPDSGIPYLKPGNNTISLTHPALQATDISTIVIKNASRWL